MEDGCSGETLEAIHKVSEIYRNFTATEFGAFRSEFERGYASAKETLGRDFDPAALEHKFSDFDPD